MSAVFIGLGILFILVFFELTTINGQSEITKYWVGLLSGNWSPGYQPPSIGNQQFAISSLIAIILNLGNLLGIGLFLAWSHRLLKKIAQLETRSERIMKLNEALLLRDWSIKTSFFAHLSPDDRKRLGDTLEKSFAEGAAIFKDKHLDTFFGPTRAAEIREYFSQQDLGPIKPSP